MAWWGKHRLATGVYLLDERIQHLASSLYIVSVLSVIPLKVKILHPDRYVIILRLIAMDWKIRAKAVGYITFRHFSVCVCVSMPCSRCKLRRICSVRRTTRTRHFACSDVLVSF